MPLKELPELRFLLFSDFIDNDSENDNDCCANKIGNNLLIVEARGHPNVENQEANDTQIKANGSNYGQRSDTDLARFGLGF